MLLRTCKSDSRPAQLEFKLPITIGNILQFLHRDAPRGQLCTGLPPNRVTVHTYMIRWSARFRCETCSLPGSLNRTETRGGMEARGPDCATRIYAGLIYWGLGRKILPTSAKLGELEAQFLW